jgi:hypothetical protein
MFLDRFDTDKYTEFLEARKVKEPIDIEKVEFEYGYGCLRLIQLFLYFLLLLLVMFGIYKFI